MRVIGRVAAALVAACCISAPGAALAGGRVVVGAVTQVDARAGTLIVTDGLSVRWNFRVDPDSGIGLGALSPGDRVRVEIARATPLNMMSAADILRKGDTVTRLAPRAR